MVGSDWHAHIQSAARVPRTLHGGSGTTMSGHGPGNNRPLPSLARPSLPHRLDCKGSKIFVHPVRTRLDVCNGRTRSLSHCHLVWWTSAQESRRKSKTLHKPDAASRREHPINVTRSPVADESRTCRQHTIRAQGRVFNRACSRCTQEDRRCDGVPCQQKHRFLPSRAFMTAVNITITRIPRLCLRAHSLPQNYGSHF